MNVKGGEKLVVATGSTWRKGQTVRLDGYSMYYEPDLVGGEHYVIPKAKVISPNFAYKRAPWERKYWVQVLPPKRSNPRRSPSRRANARRSGGEELNVASHKVWRKGQTVVLDEQGDYYEAALVGGDHYVPLRAKVLYKEPESKHMPFGTTHYYRVRVAAPKKSWAKPSPSRRANSATFRSFEHASMVARAYPSSTGWKTEARYPTKQSAHLGAVDFVRKGRHQSGTIRIVEIREPRVEYVVKYKPKGAGTANPRRSARRSSNPQYTVKRGSRQVVIYSNSHRGPFESRLYVNNGETATLTNARHKTLAGAMSWANKTLDKHIAAAGPRAYHPGPKLGPVRVNSNPRTTSKQVGDWRQESKWDILQGRNKIGEIEYKGMVYQGRAWMPWGSYRGVSGKQTLEGMKRAVVAAYNRAWKGVGETVSGATRSAPRSSNPGRGSSNPHAFHDAHVKVTRKGEVKIAIHNPNSAAAFLKVMGRRKNTAENPQTKRGAGQRAYLSMAKHAGMDVGSAYPQRTSESFLRKAFNEWVSLTSRRMEREGGAPSRAYQEWIGSPTAAKREKMFRTFRSAARHTALEDLKHGQIISPGGPDLWVRKLAAAR